MSNKPKFKGLANEARLRKLTNMPDNEIDYSDIEDMSKSKGWKKLYPTPTKESVITDKMMFDALVKAFEEDDQKLAVTIKLNRRIIDFFKSHSNKYQTKINEVLLAFVDNYEKLHSH